MTREGAAGIAIAVLAEHVTAGYPLAEIVARLGATDRATLQTAVVEVEQAAIMLRDIIAPRRNESVTRTDDDREAPPNTSVRNRYDGKCQCGRHVPAGRGRAIKTAIGSKWEVCCYPCASERNLT